MERSQFTFYDSYFKSVSRIRKKSARADAYDAICKYALLGIEPNLDSMDDAAAIAFLGAKPNIDAGRRKAESGCKGGTSKDSASKPKANGKQSESKNKNKDKKKNKNKNKNNRIPTFLIKDALGLKKAATANRQNTIIQLLI